MIGHYLRLLSFCLFLGAPSLLHADSLNGEQSYLLPDLNYLYEETFCAFQIGFPSEPTIEDISSPETGDLKATSLSFLKVFGIDKSVRITANCKEITKDIRNLISEDSIDKDLATIEQKEGIKRHSKTSKALPEERLRIGTLAGSREDTPDQGIYIYQVWVSDTSVFTLEAEVTGPEYPEADKILVAVLQSFKKKEGTITPAESVQP